MTGHGVRSVYVAGELYLAQQIVFRAVAVGARIVGVEVARACVRAFLDGRWKAIAPQANGPAREEDDGASGRRRAGGGPSATRHRGPTPSTSRQITVG